MNVTRGFVPTPERIGVYGPEGVGKTTFAMGSPGAIFVGTEDGGGDLDLARLPAITTWTQLTEQILWLTTEPHEFHTIVLDTIDHLEKVCWRHICEEGKVDDIEAYEGGYGKGFTRTQQEMVVVLGLLDQLRHKRRMRVIWLAHAHIRPFKNPDGPDYDRWTLRMNDKCAAVWKEWADVLLFADYDVRVITAKRGTEDAKTLSKGKAVGDGDVRKLYTTRSPAYDAKNRYHLPEELDLSWAAFEKAMGDKLWSPVPHVVATGHHPSYTEAEGKAFAVGLGKLTPVVSYDGLAAWLEGDSAAAAAVRERLGVPPSRPSAWAKHLRTALFKMVARDPAKFVLAFEGPAREPGGEG